MTVWLDEAQMWIAHSLRRKIDEGIRTSRFGIVVLSAPPSPRAGPTTNSTDSSLATWPGHSLLPIWHNLSAEDVRRHSPYLADKVAMSTSDSSIEEIAQQIADVVQEENAA